MDEPADDGRRTGLNGWLQGLPKPVRWLLGGAAIAAYYVLAVLVLSRIHHGRVDWWRPLPGVLSGLGGTSLALWLRSRRMGGRQRAREFERALRTGRLPAQADPSEWRLLLQREERARHRAAVITFGVLGALLLGVSVLLVVLGAGWPVWWPSLGILLVLVALLVPATASRRRRMQRLLAQVGEEPASSGS